MEPIVCNFLRKEGSLQDLYTKYGIHSFFGQTMPNLVGLKYDQKQSQDHFGLQLVRECRALILDTADDYRCVSRSFDKFFNRGEKWVDRLNPATTKYFEKVDGSLITVYNYNGHWCPSTTGSVEASGNLQLENYSLPTWHPNCDELELPTPQTFAQLFWQLARMRTNFFDRDATGVPSKIMPGAELSNLCFMFELTSPFNLVVLPHKSASLTLLGARNRLTGEELWPDRASVDLDNAFTVVKVYSFRGPEDVPPFPKDGPLLMEGYVRFDGKFRDKDKDPRYVDWHLVKSSLSVRSMTEMIRNGDDSEFTSYYPSYEEKINGIKDRYLDLVRRVEEEYDSFKDIVEQREFALATKKAICPSAMFQFRAGKTKSIKEFFEKIHIDALLKYLKLNPTDKV